uniref:NADH-ubiquinone oxidoreductase chain 3 n=1 Tax=Paruterina candelabraria TaxID=2364639 RepID=A0A386HV96_9CEST|nr:NADH dehydrogenase subunit 3 [Paruterina candelabraria]AYD49585.1 NADH dehydrogenase subunit 3 [Paruterina candelabraria]
MIVLFFGLLLFTILGLIIWLSCSSLFNNNNVISTYWCSPYECGFVSNSLSFNFFSFTYFSLLVFFVIFDLEISLLLNMSEQGLLFDNFIYYYMFLFILLISFVLEIFGGYVHWGY